MSKILITGVNGFIGSALKPRLEQSGHEVIDLEASEGDISNEKTWSKFPRADVLIHLAARSFVPDSWADPGEYFRTNVDGTLYAIKYCKEHSSSMIFMSSYLYGNPDKLPIGEEDVIKVNNPYALTKKVAEDICEFYAHSESLNITVFRPFNIYGIGQSSKYLIPKIIDQLLVSDNVNIFDLSPKRDYIYLNDFLDAILLSITHLNGYQIFNIGSGISYSVGEIIEMLEDILGIKANIICSEEKRKAEIENTIADISKAKDVLDWSPSTTLRQGLKLILSSKGVN